MLSAYVQAAREAVGMEIPLSMDHLGHLGVNSIIRLGKAYEKFNLSWMEDVIPWQYTDMLAHITAESPTPILTGEDIYLKEDFIKLCEKHAVSKIHPDISTSGGILETHKIGERGMELGVPMAMHYAGTPVGAHGQRPLRRRHGEFPGVREPLAGCPVVAGSGGRHREADHQQRIHQGSGQARPWHHLNDEVCKQHLRPGTGYFEPTPQWDKERSGDWLWSMMREEEASRNG